jgi:hypothetical protein
MTLSARDEISINAEGGLSTEAVENKPAAQG